jgi:hypothetical protein
MRFELVHFPRAEGALWPISPPQDVLPYNFGNFSFGQLFLPRCQIHMCLQVNAFPVQVSTAPGVFQGIVLPIVSYSCYAYPYSLGADVGGSVRSAQNWPLLLGVFPEKSSLSIYDFPEGVPSHQLSVQLGRCTN